MTDQTMRIVRDTDGHGYTVYDEMEVGGVVHKSEFWIRADRLHLLATAAQAALAERNSKAMAERCQCGLKLWGDKYPICAAWKQSPVKSVKGCAECGHDDPCHHQAQRREA